MELRRLFFLKLIFALSFAYGAAMLYAKTKKVIPPQDTVKEYAARVVNGELPAPDLVIVGDSVAATAFQASRFGKRAYSLALFGGSSPEAYFLLRKMKEFPRCLIISFSYNWERYVDKNDGHFWDMQVTDFYSVDELREIGNTAAELGLADELPASKMWAEWLLSRIWISTRKFGYVQESIFSDERKIRMEYARRLVEEWQGNLNKNREGPLTMVLSPDHDFLLRPFRPAPLFDHYLGKILSLAEERGAAVRFVSVPYHREIQDSPEALPFLRAASAHLRKLVEARRNAVFLPMRRPLPDGMYNDATHLNLKGSETFTEELVASGVCGQLLNRARRASE